MQVDATPLLPKLQHIVGVEDLASSLAKVHAPLSTSLGITRLVLRDCEALTDDALVLLQHALPALAALEVTRCANVSDGSLRGLARHRRLAGRTAKAAEADTVRMIPANCVRDGTCLVLQRRTAACEMSVLD